MSSQTTAGDVSRAHRSPVYLSDFIQQGRLQHVHTSSKVDIPGLDVLSYAGYITVDEKYGRNLFFWFFPSTEVPPDKAPLLVYLNGGPGNSSMIGLFEEVGPLQINQDGEVGKREITWTDQFSVIFIDSPVGTGFSYSSPGDEVKTNDVCAENLYSFLIQFLQLFPEYQACDLYLGGISYAGKYVPAFAYKVHTEESRHPFKINLKGVFISSGMSDPGKMLPIYPVLLQSLGFLKDWEARELRENIIKGRDKPPEEAVKDMSRLVFSDLLDKLGYKELDNALIAKSYNWKFPDFLNRPDIQAAIHVKPTEYNVYSNTMLLNMAADFFDGVTEEMSVLLENYKVLLYNGHLDLLVSVPMTEVFLKDLPWSGRDEYLAAEQQKWLAADGDVAGYVTKVRNFTRVVVRNAGHRTAIDQPAWVKDLICKFIHDQSF
ncbi:hypothetical protein BsWGS_27593 [Bradybaena similaris]